MKVVNTIGSAIAAIDAAMSKQLAAIIRHGSFRRLEGSWRGLHYLVTNSHTGDQLRIRVLDVSKRELYKDFEKATEFDQSWAYREIRDTWYGSRGGEPYGALVGDYEFTNHPDDIDLLTNMSQVSAAGFCPFLSGVAPGFFGVENFGDLSPVPDLRPLDADPEYSAWRAFRETPESRYVVLTVPRTLVRAAYSTQGANGTGIPFEGLSSARSPFSPSEHCWMNTAYVAAVRLCDAFELTGSCTAIVGLHDGGGVSPPACMERGDVVGRARRHPSMHGRSAFFCG